MAASISAPRARRRGRLRGGSDRPRERHGSRSSTSPPPATSRWRTDDGRFVLVYNGELYNYPRARARARGARAPFRLAHRHGGRAARVRGVGRRPASTASTACSRSRSGTTRERELFARPRPLRRSSRSTTRTHDGRLLFALRGQGAARGRLPRARLATRRSSSTSPSRTSSPTLTLFDGVRMLPAGHMLPCSPTDVERRDALLGPRARAGRVASARTSGSSGPRRLRGGGRRGSSSATCRSAATSRAAWTRPRSSAVASAAIPRLMTFTGGFDLELRRRARARLRRAGRRRARREHVPHRALRDGHARGRHGLGAARARLAPRGPARRDVLPEPLHRPARVEVRQGRRSPGPAATSCSPAIRGATTLVEGLDDPAEFERRHYDYWSRLVPEAEQPAVLHARACGAIGDASPLDSLSRRRWSRPPSSTRSRRRSTSRRRRSCTGCSSSRTSVSMAHSLEVRVPFLDNELVDLARRIPARLKHADDGGKRLLRER